MYIFNNISCIFAGHKRSLHLKFFYFRFDDINRCERTLFTISHIVCIDRFVYMQVGQAGAHEPTAVAAATEKGESTTEIKRTTEYRIH